MSDSAWGDGEAQGAGKHARTGPRLPPNAAAVPQEKLWETKADGSQHAGGQQHRLPERNLGQGRTGRTTPSSSTEAGKSSSEKRTTSTIRSHQWWEISPGGLSGHRGFVELQRGLTQGWEVTQTQCKKQDLFALPLCKMRKGAGKHVPTPPSCRVFTPCGLLEYWLWSGCWERLYSRQYFGEVI